MAGLHPESLDLGSIIDRHHDDDSRGNVVVGGNEDSAVAKSSRRVCYFPLIVRGKRPGVGRCGQPSLGLFAFGLAQVVRDEEGHRMSFFRRVHLADVDHRTSIEGAARRSPLIALRQAQEPGLSGSRAPVKRKRLLAHPPEPGYPCYVSVLGELAWMAPREEPASILQTPEGSATAPRPPRSDVATKHGRIAEAEIARATQSGQEDSPSGLWRTLGKRVGLTPSGVRIPHSPPDRTETPIGNGGRFCLPRASVAVEGIPRA